MDSKRRETLVKPLIDGRIQHTASRRESTIASPPEDRSGGDGGGRESELLGFTAEELWRSSSQSMDEGEGERGRTQFVSVQLKRKANIW